MSLKERAEKIKKVFDRDGDGKITAKEVAQTLTDPRSIKVVLYVFLTMLVGVIVKSFSAYMETGLPFEWTKITDWIATEGIIFIILWISKTVLNDSKNIIAEKDKAIKEGENRIQELCIEQKELQSTMDLKIAQLEGEHKYEISQRDGIIGMKNWEIDMRDKNLIKKE